MTTPILYTFRRCPYAIRARLAILVSGVTVEEREVSLKNKPQAMLDISPKGTVPVLQLADGRVIDESLDIMRWALEMNDPQQWLSHDHDWLVEAASLINENDGSFKQLLDRYKYPARFQTTEPLLCADHYRDEAGVFLRRLGSRLATQPFLMGAAMSLPDVAIFPFVRQFAAVDKTWFDHTYAGPVAQWLDVLVGSPIFVAVMRK
ncbi:MAG: glutathione S-transferase [Betaproteobacteria bacterium]